MKKSKNKHEWVFLEKIAINRIPGDFVYRFFCEKCLKLKDKRRDFKIQK